MRAGLPFLLLSVLALSGCQDIFNTLLDNGAPTGVTASDGDYANEISVSWAAPSMTGDKWKDDSIRGYTVSWDRGPAPNSRFTSSTSYSIPVAPADRAQPYSVTVTTEFQVSSSSPSGSDSGFAIDTEDLLWRDGGTNLTLAGSDRWYVTMLQKGFTYSFRFPPGRTAVVAFYPYKSLVPLHQTSDLGSVQSWKCDEDGSSNRFYVKVSSDLPPTPFIASFSF